MRMWIPEGTLALGIQIGDIIAMDPRTVVTESGYIKSRFLDDKLSAAILLGLAHAVKEDGLKLNLKSLYYLPSTKKSDTVEVS